MKQIFNPEDFSLEDLMHHQTTEIMFEHFSNKCNKIINKLIDEAPIMDVKRAKDITGAMEWFAYTQQPIYQKTCTHKARLMFIEELPKKECLHEPDTVGFFWDQLSPESKRFAYNDKCKHCGVELVAKWEQRK